VKFHLHNQQVYRAEVGYQKNTTFDWTCSSFKLLWDKRTWINAGS